MRARRLTRSQDDVIDSDNSSSSRVLSNAGSMNGSSPSTEETIREVMNESKNARSASTPVNIRDPSCEEKKTTLIRRELWSRQVCRNQKCEDHVSGIRIRASFAQERQ